MKKEWLHASMKHFKEIIINSKEFYLEEDTIRCIKESECEYCCKWFEKQNIIQVYNVGIIRTVCDKCLKKWEESVVILPIEELFILLARIED